MTSKIYKKASVYTIYTGLVLTLIYSVIEPAYLYAQSATDTVLVTLTVDAGISITSPVDTVMSPNIGIAANSSIGSVTWNVKTNDPDGYTLAVRASSTPAMVSGGNSFADYTPAIVNTPDAWTVPSGSIEFGYSAYGTDVPTATWGTGSSCGTAGTPSATQKWDGFTTSNRTVATKNATTTTSGVDTSVCFAAEQDTVFAAAGVYTASVIATATVQ